MTLEVMFKSGESATLYSVSSYEFDRITSDTGYITVYTSEDKIKRSVINLRNLSYVRCIKGD